MNTKPHELEDLEVELVRILVAIRVRDPNAEFRIQRAMSAVSEAGMMMIEDLYTAENRWNLIN